MKNGCKIKKKRSGGTVTENIELSDGINLCFSRDRRFRTGAVVVRFLAPLDIESASAITLLFRVLARGSALYPTAADIRRRCDMLWGATLYQTSSPIGEIQNIGFTATFINEKFLPPDAGVFDGLCGLIRDVIFNPLLPDGIFSEEYVESERENLISELMNEDDKSELCRFRMESNMFDGEKFNICADGEADRLKKITAQSLTSFYRSFIRHASVEVCLFADIGRDDAIMHIKKIFEGGTRVRRDFPIADVIRHASGKLRILSEKRDIFQSRICIGFRTGCVIGDPDYPAFELMCELLGRSPTNLLYTNLRERKRLCYSCSVSTEVFKGLLRVECGCDHRKVRAAYESVFEVIDSVSSARFSEKSLEDAKKSLISAYRSISDDPLSDILMKYRQSLSGVQMSPEEFIRKTELLTSADIAGVAAKLEADTAFILGSGETGT